MADPKRKALFSGAANEGQQARAVKCTRNYVTWGQDGLNRMKLLERN